MKNFWVQILIFVVLGTFVFTKVVNAAPKISREQLVYAEKKAKDQALEHKRLQAKSLEVSIEMTKLNNSLVSAAKEIQNNEKSLSLAEGKLENLQKELGESEKEFNQETRKMANTIAALQNLSRKPVESLFVQPLTPVEIIRSAILLREIVPEINANAESVKKQLQTITEQKKQIEKQVKEIKTKQSQLSKDSENLKVLMNKKKAMQKDLEKKTEVARRQSQELFSQAKDLRELFEKIEKNQKIRQQKQLEEKRRLENLRKQEKMRAEAEYKAKDDLYDDNQEVMKSIAAKFVKAKGLLARPVTGPVVISYGQETAKGVTSKGIHIKTRKMAQVVAPFDGAVAFSGPFKGYGNVIIIEHGNGYLSLLSGLNNIDCEIGQMLLAGEPIGQMPDTESKLYMEIRKDSLPVNPEIWLSK